MVPVHVVVVTDEESGHQGLYVGGDLADQEDTLYACDIAAAIGDKVVQFSHVVVNMPEKVVEFPKTFDECMLWKPVSA